MGIRESFEDGSKIEGQYYFPTYAGHLFCLWLVGISSLLLKNYKINLSVVDAVCHQTSQPVWFLYQPDTPRSPALLGCGCWRRSFEVGSVV